ncbi:MAG: hypothetical protein ACLFRT_13725 [Actinomycetota bacterium]
MTQTSPALERVYPPKLMFMIVNPIMRFLLGTGAGKRFSELARLEFTGRKTGKEYAVVTAIHDIDGRDAALTNSGWRWNFQGGREIVKVQSGKRERVQATLVTDPDEVARVYSSMIQELGVEDSPRRLGIRINVDGMPTHEQLVDLAEREGLSVVYLDPLR